MQLSFTYNKKKVIQALRYHFISKREIKFVMIMVNIFAITSAILFYFKKIRPEPFLLGSVIWLVLMVSVWYILPFTIYKKEQTFKEGFTIFFGNSDVTLQNKRGHVDWSWQSFSKYLESPNFFHLYFNSQSFFLIPKDEMTEDFRNGLRQLLQSKIV